MSIAENQGRGEDPGGPGHERFPGLDRPEQAPVDAATWGQVREGQQVVSSTGESLGRVQQKSDYVFVTELREGLLRTRELYVPHMLIARVERDTVQLDATKAELDAGYEHYRRYHFGHSTGSND